MKKVIFIVFVSLLFPVSSYGATKVEGSKCFAHTKTKKVSGVQYLCHKKNGKLVWTKDNSVKPKETIGSCQCPLCCPISTKETTPVPTPTLTPTPTPSPTPVITTTPLPTAKPLSQIEKLQLKIINSFEIQKNNNEANLIVIQSPSIDKNRVSEIVKSYKLALKSFGSPIKEKMTLIFMNETDKDWWLKTSRELDGTAHNDNWWNNPSCRITVTALCAYSPGGDHITLYTMIGSKTNPNGLEEMLWYHEAAHLYQYQLTIKEKSYPNCWIIEGQANALGFAFASKSFDNSKERSMILTHDIARIFPNYKQYSKEDWINNFIKLTSDFSYCINLSAGYSVGMLAVESLYYYNDGEKVNSFISHYYSTPETFESSLKSILGIDLNRFYSNFAEYSMITLNS